MVEDDGGRGGGGGEYRRRNHAIAAAEAAASYIMSSDQSLVTNNNITNNIRNRFVAAPASGAAGVTYHNNVGVSITSREAMMQRLLRRRPSSKIPSPIVVIVIILVIVIVFATMGEQRRGDSTTRTTTKKTGTLPQHSLRALHSKQNSHQKIVAPSTETAESSQIVVLPSAEEQEEGISTVMVVDESSIAEEEIDGRTMMMIENRHPEEYEESVAVPADAITTTVKQQLHQHAIPSILIFTYHTNLLTTSESDLGDEEDVALAHNTRSIISLHTNDSSTSISTTTTTVRFLTDDDCLDSIRMALGHDTNLTTYFTTEKHGMYKADICRGAALYESGGLYFDVDIEARMSMFHVLHTQTKFVTSLVHKDSNHHGMFFQAFIGSTPHHPILKRYLELFLLYYEGKVDVSGPLGVYFLRMAYNDIMGNKGEVMIPYIPDDNSVDLWQEVRYQPDLFPDVTREHWGSRRACQMIVVAPLAIGRKERMVPLFSHANGSRMCPM